ncbi:branched-chain amino acid ABC transporter permease [Acholeplasma hippikon]|uniref:LIV-I protein H n=1 Tax=Acholeplasma hippikon TaxID=264636 RepID=A0A449BJU5_9MOLU|nr:branched-chain amino acid ABC transporter permease [Acholeplasma hippikon]VEU82722.1 LIV-I protein H [Acholeplasma hippikon]
MAIVQDVLNIIVPALISFGYLALATFGIVLIYKTSSTTNFAQGMLGVLGAFTTSYLIDKQGIQEFTGLPSVVITSPWQLVLPMIAGIAVSFVVGFFIDAVIFRKSKFTNAATKQIITMGLVIIITGLIPIIFGTQRRNSFQFSSKTIQFAGIALPVHQLVTLLISTVVIVGIFLLLRFTKWGLGVRSVASNERVASLMGINTNRINALSWAIAGALGALSAITYTAGIGTLNAVSMVQVQVDSFYASILGGFDTFFGPLGGLLIMNLGRSAIPAFLIKFNLAQWSNTVIYILIMVAVLIKPVGIFGKKKVKKV